MKKIIKKIKKVLKDFSRKSIILNQKIRINTLEVKLEAMENIIKNELYKEFMQKITVPEEIERLTKENKRLRIKNKELKELLKDNEILL